MNKNLFAHASGHLKDGEKIQAGDFSLQIWRPVVIKLASFLQKLLQIGV